MRIVLTDGAFSHHNSLLWKQHSDIFSLQINSASSMMEFHRSNTTRHLRRSTESPNTFHTWNRISYVYRNCTAQVTRFYRLFMEMKQDNQYSD